MNQFIVKHYDAAGNFKGFEAYGSLVQNKEEAKEFENKNAAEYAAQGRYGLNFASFWECERIGEKNLREDHRGWFYRLEEVKEIENLPLFTAGTDDEKYSNYYI